MKKIHILKQPNKQVFIKKYLLSMGGFSGHAEAPTGHTRPERNRHGPVQGTAFRGRGGMGRR